MRRRGQTVPGAVRRLARDGLRVTAVVLLALATVLVAGVQAGARIALQTTLDENWRGAYDLLVTARSDSDDPESAAVMLPPNSLGSGPENGLSFDQLQAIRSIPGVEVAAPIAQVAVRLFSNSGLDFAVPVAEGVTTPQPLAYRVRVRFLTDDGLGPRLVWQQDYDVVVDHADLPARDRLIAQVSGHGRWRSQRWSNSDIVDGYVVFEVVQPPRVTPMLTIVDPAAESALLGEAGAFLQPLLDSANTSTVDGSPALPVVVSAMPAVALTAEVTVDAFGPARIGPSDSFEEQIVLPAGLESGEAGTSLGTVRHDISALFDPFTQQRIVAPWPGLDPGTQLPARSAILEASFVTGIATIGAPEVDVSAEGTAVLTASAFAEAYHSPTRGPVVTAVTTTRDGTDVGAESIYASIGDNRLTPNGLALVQVGEFDPAVVRPLTQELSYVPLGGYDPVGSTLVADASGTAIDPVDLRPSVSGLGLVNQATTMVGSFDAMGALLGAQPISAVRVRVSGMSQYSPESIAKVEDVRRSIEALGLRATIVAGSSPAPMRVTVDNYAFGTLDVDVPQRVGTLGVVEQRWSELAAATRIDIAVSHGTTAALIVGLAACATLLGAATLVGVSRRRREAAVFAAMGWGRGRIARWYAAEELVAVLVLIAVGGLAVATARDRPLTTAGAGAALGIAVLLGAISVVASVAPPVRSVRASSVTHGSTRVRAMGVFRFGLRQVKAHQGYAASVLLTMATAGLAVMVLGVLVLDERDRAGQSLLAAAVTDRVLVARLALGAVATIAGIALAVLARRIDIRIRTNQEQVLRAMGWTGRVRRKAHAAEAGTIIVLSGLIVGPVCWFVASALRPAEAVWLTVLGEAVALAAAGLTLFGTSKGGRA